ncbi:C2 domain-containing protein [Aureococcus anophagefferens]|nr:C2 domain-containing protein [Aureococcus anophagefferens]
MEPVARIRGYVHAYRSPEVKSVCARLASARSADDLAARGDGGGGESGVWALGALALNLEPRRLRYAAAPPPRKKKPDGDDDDHEEEDDDPAAGATTPDEVRAARLADVSGENAAEAFRAYCAKGDKGASMGPEAARDWLRSAAEKALARADRGAATTHRGAHFLVGVCGKDATGPVPAPRVPSERLNDDAPAAGRHALRHLDGPRLLKLAGDPFRLAAALDPQIFGDDASFVSAQSGGSVDAASPAVAAAALAARAVDAAFERYPLPAEVAAPFFDEATAAILDDSFDVRHGARATRGDRNDAHTAELKGVKMDRRAAVFLAAAAGAAAVGDGARGIAYLTRAVKLRRDRYLGDGHPMVASALCALAAAQHRHAPGSPQSQVAHEWAIEALRKTRGAEHHPMDAPGGANHVKAALAEDERKALIDQYEDRDAPEQHTRGVARARVGSAVFGRTSHRRRSSAARARPRPSRHKAMRKYGRRDRELPGGGRRGDDDDSFSGSEAFTSSGGEEGDEANDLGGEHRSQARRNRPELYRALDETKARDGSESGSDIEDKPLYLLPENQHHPPEFLTGAAPQRFPVHIAGT